MAPQLKAALSRNKRSAISCMALRKARCAPQRKTSKRGGSINHGNIGASKASQRKRKIKQKAARQRIMARKRMK